MPALRDELINIASGRTVVRNLVNFATSLAVNTFYTARGLLRQGFSDADPPNDTHSEQVL